MYGAFLLPVLYILFRFKVIAAVAATGTNVVVTGGTVSEMALHFCEKYRLMVVKSPSKWDIRRLCATVGATALTRLGPATPEEVSAWILPYLLLHARASSFSLSFLLISAFSLFFMLSTTQLFVTLLSSFCIMF